MLWIRISPNTGVWAHIQIPVEAGKTRRFHGVSKLEVEAGKTRRFHGVSKLEVEAGKTRRFHGVSKLEVSQKARKLSQVFTKYIAFL